MRTLRFLALSLAALVTFVAARAADFPLKDGDLWVMAGDSITAQHLHSNYFEAFCFARYPQLKFAFRNSGVGGHTIPSTLARFDYDIDAWKPTVVSVELGMNDQHGNTPAQYIANMTKMVERIRASKARPVMFSASPMNNGDTLANLGGNKRLHEYAEALKEFSRKEQLPFADQFHRLLDVWGNNKANEVLANSLPTVRTLAQFDRLAGVENLRAFLAVQDKIESKPVSMQGDAVHPGAPGQLMMAAALLSELGAAPLVSSATLEASGKVVEAKGCTVSNAKMDDGNLSFDRLDACLPFPIPEDAASVLPLFPTIAESSRYMLQVKGLNPGLYGLKINGVLLPSALSEKAWGEGVNLTNLAYARPSNPRDVNPIAAQGRAILAAVAAKESLVGKWRGLSQRAHAAGASEELKDQLTKMTSEVAAADDKIREAATPRMLHFDLIPQK